jgi:HTH-type transcriptional regulator/antitoxin HigA
VSIHPIRTNADLKRALARIDIIIDAKHGTRQYDELDVLTTLVEAYESKAFPIDPPDPVEAILFRMEQDGVSRQDLVPLLGGKSRVSEILARRRPLSLRMIRQLHGALRIPYESLMGTGVVGGRKPRSARVGPVVRGSRRSRVRAVANG